MAKIYDITDKSALLPLAYGEHPVQGTLVRHETTAVGSDLQVKLQQALGIGPWDSCVRLTYNGWEIASQSYRFYSNGAAAGADDLFPTDVAHPGCAHINVQLPVGIATDNNPTALVGRYKTLQVADYDRNGNQIAFAYSPNTARVAMDIIKRLRPRLLQKIEWGAWCDWRDWCNVQISVVKDGVTIQIPRFEAHVFLVPPFTLEQALDRLCQISCSDWQWRGGMVRFMPPVDRAPEFAFDLSQVSPDDFKFTPVERASRPNGVRVLYRDLNDQYIKDATPVEITRPNLIALDGGQNFLEINAGVTTQWQAQRLANFWARVRCDFTDFFSIVGSFNSYPCLPADLITLTHDIPNWTNKICKIIKKEENEDDGIGYPIYAQIYPQNPYSDTDTTPLVTRIAVAGPNPYSAPPVPTLSLAQQSQTLADNTVNNSVMGTITFGSFGFNQTARVFWMKPGKAYALYTELTPDANNSATFRATDLAAGTHWFKVVAVSDLGVQQVGVGDDASITVIAYNFSVNSKLVEPTIDRTNIAVDGNGQLKGRDTGRVPTSKIAAAIDGFTWTNDQVEVSVVGSVTGAKIDATANGDSLIAASVVAFNKFGELVKIFPYFSFQGSGVLGRSFYPIKYAHPEEGYYKIQIQNYFGWSDPVYLQGNSLTLAPPAPKLRANCPLELSVIPLSDSAFRLAWQFSGNVDVYYRPAGTSTWILRNGNVSGNSFDVSGFPQIYSVEFQLYSTATPTNKSNIVRATSLQTAIAPPARPAPTGLTFTKDSTNPRSQLNAAWTRNATDNPYFEPWVNGVAQALIPSNQLYDYLTGLADNTTRSFKVRNYWAAGDVSAFTPELSATTDPTPVTSSPPTIDSTNYNTSTGQATVNFSAHGGNGQFTVEYRTDPNGAYTSAGTAIAGSPFSFNFAQTSSPQTLYIHVKQNDVAGFSGDSSVTVPGAVVGAPPSNFHRTSDSTYFDDGASTDYTDVYAWTNNGGTGNNQLQQKIGAGAWHDVAGAVVGPTATTLTYDYTVSDASLVQCRLRNTSIAGYSEII